MNRRIYSDAFFTGLVISLLCWGVLNLISYEVGLREYQASSIKFSGGVFFDWGIPFHWTNAGGFFANSVTVAASSILIGHLLNFIKGSRAGER